ncbi:MAG: RNase adapter RapZ [Candidatus Adiutrix sp.]
MMIPKTIGRLVVITGLSGSGKSTALKALEDNGYLSIDNLPIVLLPKFLAIRKESGGFIRLAVGMDAREPELVTHYQSVFSEIKDMGYELELIFIEADDDVLIKRFSETRRPHHLAPHGDILSGIKAERKHLLPLREAASELINSSALSGAKLREIIVARFSQEGEKRLMAVEVLSFGFKNGLPPEADLMVDVRFLPNPFYINELRNLDGRDQSVIDYVMAAPETAGFLDHFMSLLLYLLPLYQKEGKSYLTIAVGCTGGQHRSVTVAGFLWEKLCRAFGGNIHLRHRDIL